MATHATSCRGLSDKPVLTPSQPLPTACASNSRYQFTVYAPLQRDGHFPDAPRRTGNASAPEPESFAPSSLEALDDLIASLPPKTLAPLKRAPKQGQLSYAQRQVCDFGVGWPQCFGIARSHGMPLACTVAGCSNACWRISLQAVPRSSTRNLTLQTPTAGGLPPCGCGADGDADQRLKSQLPRGVGHLPTGGAPLYQCGFKARHIAATASDKPALAGHSPDGHNQHCSCKRCASSMNRPAMLHIFLYCCHVILGELCVVGPGDRCTIAMRVERRADSNYDMACSRATTRGPSSSANPKCRRATCTCRDLGCTAVTALCARAGGCAGASAAASAGARGAGGASPRQGCSPRPGSGAAPRAGGSSRCVRNSLGGVQGKTGCLQRRQSRFECGHILCMGCALRYALSAAGHA